MFCIRTERLIFRSSSSNNASSFATNKTKSFEFFIADSFSIAFPPIVSADMTAEIAIVIAFCAFVGIIAVSFNTIATEHAPDMIPNVSPTTSLHTFDTFSLFATSFTAVFAPYSRFARFSSKFETEQEVVATPIPSKVMLASIKNASNNSVTVRLFASEVISLKQLISADKAKDTIVILIAHELFLRELRLFFDAIYEYIIFLKWRENSTFSCLVLRFQALLRILRSPHRKVP